MLDRRGLFLGVSAAGVASVVGFLLSPADSPWQIGCFFVPHALASAVLVARVKASPTALRRPLQVLLGGQLGYFTLSLVWYLVPVVFDQPLPFPSPLDAAYFAVYGAYAVFLLMVLRRRAADAAVESRLGMTDALILTTSLVALLWIGVIAPNLTNGTSALSTAVALLYPGFNLLLFGLAARLALSGLTGTAPGLLLLFWIAAEVFGDVFYGFQSVNGTFQYSSTLTASWMVAYAALGALAAHPGFLHLLQRDERSVARAAGDSRSGPRRHTRGLRHGLLLLAGLFPLGMAAFYEEHDRVLLAVSAFSVVLLAYRTNLLSGDLDEQRRLTARVNETAGQLGAILDTVGDGIYGVDVKSRITFVNPAATDMLGFEPHELVGRNSHEVFHHAASKAGGHSRESCPLAVAMRTGVLQRSSSESFRRHDGTLLAVEKVATPMLGDGRVTGAVVSFRDVTKRREVDRLKDEFTSVVSHELRTPLTSIRGSLGLLASGAFGPVPPKGQRMLDIAVSNTDRLVRLINDILDMERIESGALAMDRQRVKVGDLLRSTLEEMEATAAGAAVQVHLNVDDAEVWADPDRVMQTLTNLLSNAIKFTDPGGSVVMAAERRGEEILLSVRDEGRGIPADRLEAIFERFQQVDSSDARDKGGTGLGLPICRSIVQQHGGRIWVESSLGEGSTFFFTLPALDDEGLSDTPAEGAPAALVCDDDASARELVTTLLRGRGFRVIAVSSGEEAVEVAARERPSVILLDLLLPGLSGWDTAARLRARPETREIPVVICSVLSPGETDLPDTVDVAGWVDKTVDAETLARALDTALPAGLSVSRVLVVEDDLDLAGVLTTMFRRRGVQTFHAVNSREALQVCQRVQPHLLVLDLMLPDGDGFTVAEWLRRDERLHSLPLVVYTAHDLDESERRRLRLGMTRFFTKGRVAPAEVGDRVMELLSAVTGTTTEEEATLVR